MKRKTAMRLGNVFMGLGLITMVGGSPDEQGYPAYWGYKDGKVVCMAIDFLVVD